MISNKLCEFCNKSIDDLYLITLTCGFVVCYDHIVDSIDFFMCHEHLINKNTCFSMKKNRNKIEEINRLSQIKLYQTKLNEIKEIKNDPKYYVNEFVSSLMNKIDVRREQIKLDLNLSVDKAFDDFYDQADCIKDNYEKFLELKLKDLDFSKLEKILDIKEVQIVEQNQLNPFLNLIEKIKNIDFENSKFKLNFSSGDFGKIINIINVTKLTTSLALSQLEKTSKSCPFAIKFISELPSGEIVNVSCLKRDNVSIWNYETDTYIQLEGHKTDVFYTTVTSNGLILSISSDAEVILWENDKVKNSFKIFSITYYMIKCDFSRLVLYDTSFNISVFDLTTGITIKDFRAHESPVISSLYLTENEYITSHEDKTIRLWNLESCLNIKTYTEKSRVFSMCKLNNREIVLGTENGELVRLNLISFKKIQTAKVSQSAIEFIHYVEENKFICLIQKHLKLWFNLDGTFRVLSRKKFDNVQDVLSLRNGKLLVLDNSLKATIWK
ncbi:unnamed protein product [Brachionus calyciflorus]|uniref:Serine-threonine kinase receptor-associated protein n=1 Tax=Brachionus calyciflorus TaxID=104777 RepID=A0A813WWF5_9BILA|nr:unnamed protein product [Brachionus calyciflorus]